MMYFDEKEVATFRAEAALMHAVNNHPHIVNFCGAVSRNGNFCLVTDYCRYGSVYDVLVKRRETLPYPVLVKVARDAASGILHLHKVQRRHAANLCAAHSLIIVGECHSSRYRR
jgi:serine/threonine protein kinase